MQRVRHLVWLQLAQVLRPLLVPQVRQALLAHGIGEARFRKIEGVADREPLVRTNPQDPRNRRISILLIR